jgi:CheY-like chemotaxis protein
MTTILVLEDNPDLLELYTQAFSFKGYDVAFSNCAEGAIAKFTECGCPPDMAVLDMLMPGLTGDAVVEFIRLHSQRPDIPILVVSCDEVFEAQLRWADVTFMRKPVELEDLFDAVSSNLDAAIA